MEVAIISARKGADVCMGCVAMLKSFLFVGRNIDTFTIYCLAARHCLIGNFENDLIIK